ncbi:MAG: response regulator [Deltaproteobacteria bacterium]|nr:response regulator [Deltaproteobacteria bacterium]
MKPSTPSHRPEPCGTPPTVLVVDDEPGIGLVCAAHLTGLDLRVLTAGTGHEALAFLAVEPVDLLLTDHCMPGMTGADLLERARRDHPQVVRILFTGAGDTRIAEEATRRGEVFRFLAKPFDRSALEEAVAAGLEHREALRDQQWRDELLERLLSAGQLGSGGAGPRGGVGTPNVKAGHRACLDAYARQQHVTPVLRRVRDLLGAIGLPAGKVGKKGDAG